MTFLFKLKEIYPKIYNKIIFWLLLSKFICCVLYNLYMFNKYKPCKNGNDNKIVLFLQAILSLI